MAIDKDTLPPELLQAYLDGKCGFFVGAGLSQGAGFPDWKGLLLDLVAKAEGSRLLPAEQLEECRRLADDPSKYLLIAEEMKEVFGPEFNNYIAEVFTDDRKAPTDAHELLVKLHNRKFIITTNYDMLIENAFVNEKIRPRAFKYYEAHSIQRSLYKREFFILKAHGDAESAAERIIVTEKDYRNILYQQRGYQSALQSIFTMYSVIFVGTSLADPELKLLLSYINAAFPEGGITHYALLAEEDSGKTEQGRWRKDYNMRIIPISTENNYEDVTTFLRILYQEEQA